MAKFDVVDMSGKKVSTVELSDAVFGITPNEKAVHRTPRSARKSAAAAKSLGARRAPATHVRVLSALRSGPTVVLLSAPSRVITLTPSTRRSSAWLCSAPCLTRLPTAT